MLSPFGPFLAEEAWDALPGTEGSVHGAEWPEPAMIDEAHEETGALIAEVASEIRGWKSDEGMALNAELDKVEVYPDEVPEAPVDTYDLSEAVSAPVHVREGVPSVELVPVDVDPDHATIGPEFRDRAGAVIGALESMDPATVAEQKELEGEIEVDLGGEVAVLPGDAVDIREEHRAASGEEVVVLEGETATILVYE
jgi:valyl-tRNA synthetase